MYSTLKLILLQQKQPDDPSYPSKKTGITEKRKKIGEKPSPINTTCSSHHKTLMTTGSKIKFMQCLMFIWVSERFFIDAPLNSPSRVETFRYQNHVSSPGVRLTCMKIYKSIGIFYKIKSSVPKSCLGTNPLFLANKILKIEDTYIFSITIYMDKNNLTLIDLLRNHS